jgi:hypothetical protein
MNLKKDDIDDDYEFARSKYYNLVEKGDEAIELMLELARESEHPRAFEVLSNMMKQNAEIADRLMDLQKKKKDVKAQANNQQALPNSMTQNNVFVGSTTDLQKMLAKKMEDRNVVDAEE